MKAPANCRLIGRWRIVEADLWDRAHLDLCGPAALTITAQDGEIAFGALEAVLEVEYARDSMAFAGPDARKAMRSREKEPPNSSPTAHSRSRSNTETVTKPSSKPNQKLLQQPARERKTIVALYVNNGFSFRRSSSFTQKTMRDRKSVV